MLEVSPADFGCSQMGEVFQSVRLQFEHADGSGMTSRSTNSSGVAIGTHVEADPMGGNAGIETLYVVEPPEPPSPAPDFPAFSVTEIDPVYTSGQRVSMTLDGMNVSYSVGMSLLGFSADVGCSQLGEVYVNPHAPWDSRRLMINQNCIDRMTLANLGIFPYTVPGTESIPDRTEYMFAPRQTLKSEFNHGTKGVPFTSSEKSRLRDAFKYVNSSKCMDWINKTLEKFIRPWDEGGQKGTRPIALSAKELISKASFNKYSDSLTADQMGITSAQRESIRNQDGYFSKFVGVTIGNQVWLHNTAFKLPSLSQGTDLPANIVHELLHVFGLEDPYVVGLDKEIQENCGWGGYIAGN